MAPTFDKLNDTNYAEWSKFMRALLTKQGVWPIVSGAVSRPPGADTSNAVKAWVKKNDNALAEACLGAKMSTSRSITDKWEHLGKSTRNEELKRLSQRNIGAAFAGLPRQSMKRVFDVDADDIEPTIEKGMQMTDFRAESNDFPLKEDLEKFLEHAEGPDALQIKKILKKYETAARPT